MEMKWIENVNLKYNEKDYEQFPNPHANLIFVLVLGDNMLIRHDKT